MDVTSSLALQIPGSLIPLTVNFRCVANSSPPTLTSIQVPTFVAVSMRYIEKAEAKDTSMNVQRWHLLRGVTNLRFCNIPNDTKAKSVLSFRHEDSHAQTKVDSPAEQGVSSLLCVTISSSLN